MKPEDSKLRLSRIKTRWTQVFQAHRGQGDEATAMQRELLLRYYRAVFLYLCGIVRDPDVAEELTHEFAVRFLRGDFRRADPSRGRFRDFLKRALRNLACDYWRKHSEWQKGRRTPPGGVAAARADADWRQPPPARRDQEAPDLEASDLDAVFLTNWRTELLTQAWEALARLQRQTGSPYRTVLRYKIDHPGMRSPEMARRLAEQLQRPLTETALRQLLRRARDKFAELVLQEVARSLDATDPDEIERELVELELLPYCKDALERLKERRGQD